MESRHCNPLDMMCIPGHPYQFIDKYFTPLVCAWQQPDFRPLYFGGGVGGNTRFPAKENYGAQCDSIEYAWNPDPCKAAVCGARKCGNRSCYVVHEHRVVMAYGEGSTLKSFHESLLGLLYDLKIDTVYVLCATPKQKYDLLQFMKRGQAWTRSSKLRPIVVGQPITEQCIKHYTKRFLGGESVYTPI